MKTLPLFFLGLGVLGGCTFGVPKHVATHEEPTFLTVIPLKYASAIEVANALNKVKSGVRLVADQRTNSLVLSYTSETDLKELTECIAQLDIEVKSSK